MHISKANVNNIRGDIMNKKSKGGSTSQNSYDVGNAEDSFELVNKYGTYEIQPTADTDNPFPKIAQALPKEKNRKKK